MSNSVPPIRVVLQRFCACGNVIASQPLPGDFPDPAPYVHGQLRRRFEAWASNSALWSDNLGDPLLRIDGVRRNKCEACQKQ